MIQNTPFVMYFALQYYKKGLCELPVHSFDRRLRNKEAELCPIQTFTTSLHKFTFSRLSSWETCASKKITLCSLEGERKNLENPYAGWVKTQVKKKIL